MEAGGFTAAAQRLGVAPAKISVEIARLESRMGVALFARTTRKVMLTAQGQALLEQCAPLLEGLLAAVEDVDADGAELTGTLRITAPVDHAAHTLAAAVARFAALHPALRVELRANDRISDLVAEGIDVGIRMGWLRDSSQRAVKLGEFGQCLLASPAYLAGVRKPRVPEDLAALDWVAMTLLPAPLTWRFTSARGETRTMQFKSRLLADSAGALRSLLRHGAGIGVLDEYSVREDIATGRLVRLLPAWRLPSGGMYAVTPPGKRMSRKAQVFIRFYQEFLAQGRA